LGIGDTSDRNSPIQVGTDTDWESVSAGNDFSLAVKTGGTLWGWGDNADYQLGIGTTSAKNTPFQIGTDTDWAVVEAGNDFGIALKDSGTLWVWGEDYYGSVTNTVTDYKYPEQLTAATNWTAIEAGYYHAAAINSDGELWIWGDNGNGELGMGGTANNATPTVNTTFGDVSAVALGYYHSLAIADGGGLYGWGRNDYGQLGDIHGDLFHRVYPYQIGKDNTWADVSAGSEYSLALDSSNEIWTWGRNDRYQLAEGANNNNKVLPWQVTKPAGVTGWSTFTAGYAHVAAITLAGDVYSWGHNQYGQLGKGTVDTYGSPVLTEPQYYQGDYEAVSAGDYFTVALKSTGEIYAWGRNYDGQLGEGTTDDRYFPFQESTASTDWTAIATGGGHVLALKADGSIWSWGLNSSGQLGLGDTVNVSDPTQVGTDLDWAEVYAGGPYSMAKKDDGSLWGWGSGSSGQLGLGGMDTFYTPVRLREGIDWLTAETGTIHTHAIKTDGTLWSWGYQREGRLGNGVDDYSEVPSPVQISSETDWLKVSAGNTHSLAIREGGTLWAWGSNHYNACSVYGGSSSTPFFPTPFLVLE
jgi:alpha-tubulin suppressor-like RCC1 family protein